MKCVTGDGSLLQQGAVAISGNGMPHRPRANCNAGHLPGARQFERNPVFPVFLGNLDRVVTAWS